jgi:acyl-CoA synthetase (NDP forming)
VIAVMMGGSQSTEQQLLESTQAAFASTGKPMVVAWSGDDESPRRLTDAGVPTFTDPSRAIAALGCLARWSLRPPLPPESMILDGLGAASAVARELCEEARADGRNQLDEFESKRILEAYGIACVPEVTAQTPAEAVTAADALGYPVAVKLLASDIAHKSELGCVRLGLTDAAGVHAAVSDIVGIAGSVGVATPRILVQRMAGPGLELLLGVKRDTTFGAIVVAGLGGVFAELLNDVALARAPVDFEQAARMLDSLRGSRVLDGFEGRPASDRAAVVDAIVRLSVLASDLQDEVAEIDVNPLIVGSTGAGAVSVDALVVLS